MRISLNITHYSWPVPPADLVLRLAEIARAAEECGVDTLWVPDHLIQADPVSSPEKEMLEAYTTLGFLAGQTERVRLGTMVTAVSYRAPSLLVKAVTTLDVLSRGRAWLGIGAGYSEHEAATMGLPLPPTAARFGQLEETLQLANRMWARDESPFEGEHFRLTRPYASPGPASSPRPPVLIGGMGERRTLPLVAKYADACNLFDIPDDGRTVTHKLGVLAAHCAEIGRPFAEIEKTLSARLEPGETARQFLDRCGRWAELGFEHVVLITPGPWTMDALAQLADAVPAAREI
ncbi:TIGR03560 family F420-dependent LLM class oxidoreductase [Amycolatopsis nigrescens]|uniref:TIGR03560 family F420-dependent LLM class oxidoreductase n=1 Tax=Amycolatopsis nigrescens TaxID=381445 RepID=UPI00035DA659|nr:TIGR03560 family F420-dependent LLM class oxidoreductase [Amycolatopsis nigrescens]